MAFRAGRGAAPRQDTVGPVRRNGALSFISVVISAFLIMVLVVVFGAARTGQSAPAGAGMGRILAAGQAGAHARHVPARQAAPRSIRHTARPARRQAPANRKVPVRGQAAPRRHGHAQSAPAAYTVRPGDTLSSIALRLGGGSAGWIPLYQANRSRVSDPDLIYPGQVLRVPGLAAAPGTGYISGSDGDSSAPARASSTGYGSSDGDSWPPVRASGLGRGTSHGDSPAPAAVTPDREPATRKAGNDGAASGGTLGCAGLAALWERAGGSPAVAMTAASIAMAESSGRQYATGPVGERGYWQIHPDHGALSTYDPYGNARAAVILSADGSNWSPWTTYTSGAYAGKCPA